ncbi:MAG: SDR family NAD(P)-dependent oxidoreductase [Chthoniobacteraceae bacterium]
MVQPISSLFSLHGRRALVTGSSRGIGAAIARALARAGADMVINYVGNRDCAIAVSDEIRAMGRRSAAIGADVGSREDSEKLIDASTELLGGLDILVSNAAIRHPENWRSVSWEHIDQQCLIRWV